MIEVYLPKRLSDDEVKAHVQRVIEDLGAKSMADMGKVMGAANKQLAGKADGSTVAAFVKELLSGVDRSFDGE